MIINVGRRGNSVALHKDNHKKGSVDQLTPSDIGAVPSTRKINSKELSGDINLTPQDIGLRKPMIFVPGWNAEGDLNTFDEVDRVLEIVVSKGILNLPPEDPGNNLRVYNIGRDSGIMYQILLATERKKIWWRTRCNWVSANENSNYFTSWSQFVMDMGGLNSLLGTGALILSSEQYGDEFPKDNLVKGRVFLKRVVE